MHQGLKSSTQKKLRSEVSNPEAEEFDNMIAEFILIVIVGPSEATITFQVISLLMTCMVRRILF